MKYTTSEYTMWFSDDRGKKMKAKPAAKSKAPVKRQAPVGQGTVRRMEEEPCLRVRQLVAQLRKMPQDAYVKFIDVDDWQRSACDVEEVSTFDVYAEEIGDDGVKTLTEAGLKTGQVIITGVTRGV